MVYPVRFGPAGIPIQCKGTSTIDGIKCCRELGLDAMEMEFVHGVRMSPETAKEAGRISDELDVRLSSHAPYYINLCSKEKAETSKKHIIDSAKITALAKGRVTVFHPGYYQKLDRETAFEIAKKNLKKIEEELQSDDIKITLGAETVGKKSAFGGLTENIRLSQELEMVEPVIDFAHLVARGDFKLKTKNDYQAVFDLVEKEINGYSMHFHSHFSEINYSEKGERNHVVLDERNEPPYKPLMELMAEQGYSGSIICESPKIDLDAIKMQEYYATARGGHVN